LLYQEEEEMVSLNFVEASMEGFQLGMLPTTKHSSFWNNKYNCVKKGKNLVAKKDC
jgi:hypothetical protein